MIATRQTGAAVLSWPRRRYTEKIMSKDEATNYTFSTGEWQWIASFFMARAESALGKLSAKESTNDLSYTTTTGGLVATWSDKDDQVLFLSVTATKKETFVVVGVADPEGPFANFWSPILTECFAFEVLSREILRSNMNQHYHDLLAEFYQRRSEGKNPKLSAMAKEYSVDYGRLRKYKIGFDAEMRQILELP